MLECQDWGHIKELQDYGRMTKAGGMIMVGLRSQ